MKKLLFGLLTTLMFAYGNAQTDAGDMFVGGTLNIGGTSFYSPDSSGFFKGNGFSFSLAPEFGYFVADNFAIGAFLGYGTTSLKSNSLYYNDLMATQKVVSNSFNAAVFGQYFLELDKKVFLSFRGSLGYQYIRGETYLIRPVLGSTATTTSYSASVVENAIFLHITPSFEYFVSDNLSLSLSYGNLYFEQIWSKNLMLNDPINVSNSSYGLNLDFSTIQLGVKFFIN
jgi:hypothetical protein